MSKSGRYNKPSHYNEDGLRVSKNETHIKRLHEKHIKNALRPHLVDYLAEEDEDL